MKNAVRIWNKSKLDTTNHYCIDGGNFNSWLLLPEKDDWFGPFLTHNGRVFRLFATDDGPPDGPYFYDAIVQHHIGRKDNHGKEIFEGDIIFYVPFTESPLEVIWSDEDSGFIGKSKSGQTYPAITWSGEHVEVIGNIFENPELLK